MQNEGNEGLPATIFLIIPQSPVDCGNFFVAGVVEVSKLRLRRRSRLRGAAGKQSSIQPARNNVFTRCLPQLRYLARIYRLFATTPAAAACAFFCLRRRRTVKAIRDAGHVSTVIRFPWLWALSWDHIRINESCLLDIPWLSCVMQHPLSFSTASTNSGPSFLTDRPLRTSPPPQRELHRTWHFRCFFRVFENNG